ncbi:hypothetical protein AW19_4135 (plasmid) [Yersinia frederiksenii Y225]|nr:hypothetical protein AW19_4135 [Yersinia frederiksenii Y225]
MKSDNELVGLPSDELAIDKVADDEFLDYVKRNPEFSKTILKNCDFYIKLDNNKQK